MTLLGVASDRPGLWAWTTSLLVFGISKTTRDCQIAVDTGYATSSLFHVATTPEDALALRRMVRFVIHSQALVGAMIPSRYDGAICTAQKDATIAGIDHMQFVCVTRSRRWVHHAHCGSGATSLLGSQKIGIDLQDHILHRLVISWFPILVEIFRHMRRDVFRALVSSVTIEHTKVAPIRLCIDDVRILHVTTPSVHLSDTHTKPIALGTLNHGGFHRFPH